MFFFNSDEPAALHLNQEDVLQSSLPRVSASLPHVLFNACEVALGLTPALGIGH